MSEKNYGVSDTGHVWDDTLRELTNDPPRWWTIGLHASWIFVLLYTIIYPAWPYLGGYTKGVMGWTSIGEYKADMAKIEEVRAPFEEKLKGMTADQIMADPELTKYVEASAKVLFGDNCAACHGSGGQGNPGFPVLADDDWLYGGTTAKIHETITNGRQGSMPARGIAGNLTEDEINQVADYVYNDLSKGNGNADVPGKAIFHGKGGCMACHGADGKGMHALGSANLTDDIWRFKAADQLASVKYTITHGVNQPNVKGTREAIMPTFGNGKSKLTPEDITKLTVYVHQLGGGQ